MEEENACSSLPGITELVPQQPQEDSWSPTDHQYINGEQQAIVWGETDIQISQAHGTHQLSLSPKAGQDTPEDAEQWEPVIWPVRPMTCTSPPINFATVQWDMPDPTAETSSLVTDSSSANELDSRGVMSLHSTSPLCRESQEVNAEFFTQEVREEEDGFDSQLLNSDLQRSGSGGTQPCDAADVQEPAAQEKEDSAHELLDSNIEIPLSTDSEEKEGHSATSDPVETVDLINIVEETEGSEREADRFVELKQEEEQEEPGILLTGQGDSEEEQTSANGVEAEEENEEAAEVEEERNVTNVSSTNESEEAKTVICLSDVEVSAEPLQTDDTGLTINPDKLIHLQPSEPLEEKQYSGSEEDTEIPEGLHEDHTGQSEKPEMCKDADQNVDPEQSAAADDNKELLIQAADTAERIENSEEVLETEADTAERIENSEEVLETEADTAERIENSEETLETEADTAERIEKSEEVLETEADTAERIENSEETLETEADTAETIEKSEEVLETEADTAERIEKSEEVLETEADTAETIEKSEEVLETEADTAETIENSEEVLETEADTAERIEKSEEVLETEADTAETIEKSEEVLETEADTAERIEKSEEVLETEADTAERIENSEEVLETEADTAERIENSEEVLETEADTAETIEKSEEVLETEADTAETIEKSEEVLETEADTAETIEKSEETLETEETSCLQHQDCDQTASQAVEVPPQPEHPESEQLEMTEELEQIQAEEQHSEDQLGEPQHLEPSLRMQLTEESTQPANADLPEESTPSEQAVRVAAEERRVAEQREQTEPSEQNERTADSSQPALSEQLAQPEKTDEPEIREQLSAETEVVQQTAEAEINQVDKQAEASRQAEEVRGCEDGSVQTVVTNGEQPKLPETAVLHMNGGEVDRETARRLAERLYKLDGIQRVDVVKHLDKDNDFSRAVGEEYLKFFDFTGQTLDLALRSFLKVVVLIGETQERERVLQCFASRFHQCNPSSFSSSGAVLALTCALMLLNTDLHGQNVGKSMSSSKFVSNLDGMNEGENFSKDLLKSLYNAIKSEPLEWAVDEEELKNTVLADEDAADDAPLRSKANPFQDVPHDKKASVVKEGFLQRKLHADIDGKRTPWGKRSWKTFCGVLKGMVLYLQKDDYRRDQLTNEEVVSVHHSLAEQAADYTKRPHVFRLQTADWRVFLFQAPSKAEMNSWINRINLVSALHSSPPFPAAVGSQKKFCRPILPASQSAQTLERQLQSHSGMLESFKADLSHLQQSLPEGKKAKPKELEEHRVRAEYLQHEMTRYEIYIQVLEAWKSVKKTSDGALSLADLALFDKAMCADSAGEEEEEEGLKKSYSSPSLELEMATPTVIKVKRNISERRTYRKAIIPRRNKEA